MPDEPIPKCEQRARERLAGALPGIRRDVAALQKQVEPTEASTRTMVADLLRYGFGFDGGDLGQEFEVRSDRADFALRIKEQIVAFVEVKRLKMDLREHTSTRSRSTRVTTARRGRSSRTASRGSSGTWTREPPPR
jgi:hypothetical protein